MDINLASESPISPEYSTTPLILAAKNGDIDFVDKFLNKGARINDQDGEGHAALNRAVNGGHVQTVNMLLDYGADVHTGHNPLFGAGSKRRIAEALLDAGADINNPSKKDGQTVLIRAVRKGDPDMVRFFLRTGARVTDKDNEGRTAETYAKQGGNKEIIELLQSAPE